MELLEVIMMVALEPEGSSLILELADLGKAKAA
jgi:hypothetical protein